jgi:hypothetical protein
MRNSNFESEKADMLKEIEEEFKDCERDELKQQAERIT